MLYSTSTQVLFLFLDLLEFFLSLLRYTSTPPHFGGSESPFCTLFSRLKEFDIIFLQTPVRPVVAVHQAVQFTGSEPPLNST